MVGVVFDGSLIRRTRHRPAKLLKLSDEPWYCPKHPDGSQTTNEPQTYDEPQTSNFALQTGDWTFDDANDLEEIQEPTQNSENTLDEEIDADEEGYESSGRPS